MIDTDHELATGERSQRAHEAEVVSARARRVHVSPLGRMPFVLAVAHVASMLPTDDDAPHPGSGRLLRSTPIRRCVRTDVAPLGDESASLGDLS